MQTRLKRYSITAAIISAWKCGLWNDNVRRVIDIQETITNKVEEAQVRISTVEPSVCEDLGSTNLLTFTLTCQDGPANRDIYGSSYADSL